MKKVIALLLASTVTSLLRRFIRAQVSMTLKSPLPMGNHYNHRSSVERVNSYLKDSFGCKHIYVKGSTKVTSHLMFGVLALCIHQSLKLLT